MLINTLVTKINKTKVTMINHSQELVDKYPLLNCTNCGTPSPTTQQSGKFIDDGISINVNDLGHYGGFTDNFPGKMGNPYAHLCHDCCVILFNALPGFAKFAEVHGGHGNITGGACYSGGELAHIENGTLITPCCPYAWTWDRTKRSGPYNNYDVYRSTPELTWEKVEYEDEEDDDFDEFI